MSMELENNQQLEETKVEQSEGVVHQKVEEEEPKPIEQPELPKDEEQGEQIFDLLGEPIATERPKTEPAKKKADKKQPAKPKEEAKYGPEYHVAYARHTECLPKEDMTLDDIRAWMEVDFPELSKERTKMDVDTKTKIIVPMVLGAKKG